VGSRGKYAGRPHSVKCPKCRRGKYSYLPQIRGITITRDQKPSSRVRWGYALTRIVCNDCGHEWWTTLLPKHKDQSPKGVPSRA
jgi:hypothetical protein